MSIYVFSDESGCSGPPYIRNATSYYVLTCLCISNFERCSQVVEIAHQISRRIFNKGLREWKKLPSKIKNNPLKLNEFLNELFNELYNNNITLLLTFVLIDKWKIIGNDLNKRKDKKLINEAIIKSYENLYRRIIPFIKKYHYIAKLYALRKPSITWYVDINSDEFMEKLIKIQEKLKKEYNVIFNSPIFVSKNSDKRILVHMIRLADVISGIISKAFEYYQHCDECKATNCFKYKKCLNPFIEPWMTICKYSKNIYITYKEEKFWFWDGVLYYPVYEREKELRFLYIKT